MGGLFVGSHLFYLSVWTFPKKREKYNHSFPVNDFDIRKKYIFLSYFWNAILGVQSFIKLNIMYLSVVFCLLLIMRPG